MVAVAGTNKGRVRAPKAHGRSALEREAQAEAHRFFAMAGSVDGTRGHIELRSGTYKTFGD